MTKKTQKTSKKISMERRIFYGGILIVYLLAMDGMAASSRTRDAEKRRDTTKTQIDSLQAVLRAYDRMVYDGVDVAVQYQDCARGQLGRLYEEYDDATREIEANQAYTMRLIKKFGQKTK